MADRDISIGSFETLIANPNLDDCVIFGCLDSFNLDYAPNTREIICDILDGVTDIRKFGGNATISFDSQELTANGIAVATGTTQTIKTGSDIDRQVGPSSGDSDTDDPAEWWVVPLSGSSPNFSFDVWLGNGNIRNLRTFIASKDNGDSAVSEATGFATGDITINDACQGKVSGSNLTGSASPGSTDGASAELDTFTFDFSSGHDQISINGTIANVDDSVHQGDTVALVGFAYEHDVPQDSSGSDIPAAQRQVVKIPASGVGRPSRIYAVHRFDKDRDLRAMIVRAWKCVTTAGVSISGNNTNDNTIMTPIEYRTLADTKHHPDSPHIQFEFVDHDSELPSSILDLLG